MKLTFFQSKNIQDYKIILEKMIDVWDCDFYSYVLAYCGIIDSDPNDIGKYWEVWLIKLNNDVIGICGSYSLNYTTKELWGGWGGFIPEYRNMGLGKQMIQFREEQAIKVGCNVLRTYVDIRGKAINFFCRNGFTVLGNTQYYLSLHPEHKEHFDEDDDYIIIEKKLKINGGLPERLKEQFAKL